VAWLVVALVLAITVALALFALGRAQAPGHACLRSDGTQEARVIVDRGYRPSRIELEAGVPTTLRFERHGDDPCTEMLVSELWPTAHRLVARGETAIRFTPQCPGRFAFTCGMGMYSGELVVHDGTMRRLLDVKRRTTKELRT